LGIKKKPFKDFKTFFSTQIEDDPEKVAIPSARVLKKIPLADFSKRKMVE
jgi:hypothetical protein